MRKALVFVGAGASLDFGVPGTAAATAVVRKSVYTDKFMRHVKGHRAYAAIVNRLSQYLGGKEQVNFEQIFHCAHELFYTYPPTPGAVNEFKPILQPFIQNDLPVPQTALMPLANHIIRTLYELFSSASPTPTPNLWALRSFIQSLRDLYVTRIYTTNYDDLILQASPDLFYGYSDSLSSKPKPFSPVLFQRNMDVDCVLHLHGSIHMGFAAPTLVPGDVGELFWFDDKTEAARYADFSGGAGYSRRMDGSSYKPTSIISGLDKTSSIQQSPFLHFYSAFGSDAVGADVIFVIGSGLSDLHVNAWLREARFHKPKTPIVLVDYWPSGLKDALEDPFWTDSRKLVEMMHALNIDWNQRFLASSPHTHWHITSDRSAAIWDAGFGSFLDNLGTMPSVLSSLATVP